MTANQMQYGHKKTHLKNQEIWTPEKNRHNYSKISQYGFTME